MKFLIWIKESSLSILLALVGIFAVAATHFRHSARNAKDKLKVKAQIIKTHREQDKIKAEQAKQHEEKQDEIQSDTYNPRDSMSRYDK